MNIQQEEQDGQGSFYIEDKGNRLAEMTYYLEEPDVMVIDHTEVDDALRGRNVGGELVDMGAEYARTKHLKIVPLCPFVKGIFEKTGSYNDVWKS